MMLDADVVAVIPASVLAGVEASWFKPGGRANRSRKGNRFRAAAAASALPYRRFLHQPMRYLLLALCSVLDGLSRFLVH